MRLHTNVNIFTFVISCDKMKSSFRYIGGSVNMKNTKLLLTVLIAGSLLTACRTNNESKTTASSDKNPVVKTKSPSNSDKSTTEEDLNDKNSFVGKMNMFAKLSKSTEEIYVTGDVVVGESGDVKPGIYDLEITGGSGNIFGDRKDFSSPFINWVAGAQGTSTDYPSKIRMVLFEGDKLNFSNISKIKFNAVPEKVQMSNELGIGEYVVGRDVKAGTYKLSTNINMNSEFQNLGWSLSIYNMLTKTSKNQTLDPSNLDVAVKLEEGEIISISLHNTDDNVSSDDARLIFTELK